MAGSTEQRGKIYNFTPHAVHYVDTAQTIVFPSDGSVRLNSGVERVVTDDDRLVYNGLVMTTVRPQELDDLDTASKDLLRQCSAGDSIIVSHMVGEFLESGYDHHFVGIRVYAPATGPNHAVRDADNRIKGVKAFEYYTTIKCFPSAQAIV